GQTRFAQLIKRGVDVALAAPTAGSPHGPWRTSNSPALAIAFPTAFFATLGLPSLVPSKPHNSPNRRIGPVRTVLWEGRCREAPPYPDFNRGRAASRVRSHTIRRLIKSGVPPAEQVVPGAIPDSRRLGVGMGQICEKVARVASFF